jgi:hypothetical protein
MGMNDNSTWSASKQTTTADHPKSGNLNLNKKANTSRLPFKAWRVDTVYYPLSMHISQKAGDKHE